jgi:hypothetical protein
MREEIGNDFQIIKNIIYTWRSSILWKQLKF